MNSNLLVPSRIPIDYITGKVGLFEFTFVYGQNLQKDHYTYYDPREYLKAFEVAHASIKIANAFTRFVNNKASKQDIDVLIIYMQNVITQETCVPPEPYVLFDDIRGAMSKLRSMTPPPKPQIRVSGLRLGMVDLPIIIQDDPPKFTRKRKRKNEPIDPGFVYLMPSPLGLYKIGLSNNPAQRKKSFNTMLPFDVEFLALIATRDARKLERSFHRKFASKRYKGEWFRLDQEDVAYILNWQSEEKAA